MNDLGVHTYNWFDSGNWKEIILVAASLRSGMIDGLNESPRTAAELARDLSLDERAVTVVLQALRSLKYVSSKNGIFRLTVRTKNLFIYENSKEYLRHSIMHSTRLLERWMSLHEVLVTGKPVAGNRLTEGVKSFIFSMNEQGRFAAKELVQRVLEKTGPLRSLVDIGGGGGLFASMFKKRVERVAIFDHPDVVAELAAASDVVDGVELVPGDAVKDVPPGKYQAALLSNITHIFGPEDNRKIFNNAAQCLEVGGYCVMVDFVRGKNASAPYFGVNMLVNNPEGNTYSEAEYLSWMEEAGLIKFAGFRLRKRDEYVIIARKEGK